MFCGAGGLSIVSADWEGISFLKLSGQIKPDPQTPHVSHFWDVAGKNGSETQSIFRGSIYCRRRLFLEETDRKAMRLPAGPLCNFGVRQQCKLRRRCATKAHHLCEPDRCHISHHMPPVISSRRAAIICTSATYSLSTCVFYLSAGT